MKRKSLNILYYAIIFIGLFSFFYFAHPMIIFNADDWLHSSYWRRPLPVIGTHNAIKVFPETFMPLISMIASTIVYPVLKDYLMSLAFAYAVTLVVFIMGFMILLEQLLNSLINDALLSKELSFLVIIFSFLIFKNDWTQNMHLFYAQDPTCVFHYTIPALLNFCLVLVFSTKEIISKRCLSLEILSGAVPPLSSGVLVLALYLAIFSNNFSNIILFSFSGLTIISHMINSRKSFRFKTFLRETWLHIVVVLMWIIAIILQFLDPRNEDAANQGAITGLSGAMSTLLSQFLSVNKMLLLFISIFVIAAIVKLIFKKKANDHAEGPGFSLMLHLALSALVTTVYLIALASVAGKGYIARPDVLIGIFEYIFILVALIMAYIFTNNGTTSRFALLLPLILFILTSQTLNYCKSYADYNIFSLSWEETYLASNDIIKQFEEASDKNASTLELHVINNDSWNNIWPYPTYAGDTIADTLFRHGIIKKLIKTEIIYDNSKNDELHIQIK